MVVKYLYNRSHHNVVRLTSQSEDVTGVIIDRA